MAGVSGGRGRGRQRSGGIDKVAIGNIGMTMDVLGI